jgi:hypothetical protein
MTPGGSQDPAGAQTFMKKHEPFLHLVGQSAAQLVVVSPQSQILSPQAATKVVPLHTMPLTQTLGG